MFYAYMFGQCLQSTAYCIVMCRMMKKLSRPAIIISSFHHHKIIRLLQPGFPHYTRGNVTSLHKLIFLILAPLLVTAPAAAANYGICLGLRIFIPASPGDPDTGHLAHMADCCNLLQLGRLIIGCMIGKQSIVLSKLT